MQEMLFKENSLGITKASFGKQYKHNGKKHHPPV